MKWTTPDFEEISLAGEVTAYVNTDDSIPVRDERPALVESSHQVEDAVCEPTA